MLAYHATIILIDMNQKNKVADRISNLPDGRNLASETPVLRSVRKHRLAQLLEGIDPKSLHSETDWGEDLGGEKV